MAAAPRRRPGGASGLRNKAEAIVAAIGLEIAARDPGKQVQVWFEDEARLGQKGTLTRVWADKGSRPRAPKQGGFKSLHIFTAVCPATGMTQGLIADRIDTAMAQRFLDPLATTIASDKHVVLFWDNAGLHTAKAALAVPANITVAGLPPRSPELNPVERLWGYLRDHHWSNRTYADLDALEAAAMQGGQKVCLDSDRIKTLCACPYLKSGSY